MKELGYGHEYRYAHDEANAYAAGERYFPDDLPTADTTSGGSGAGDKDKRETEASGRAGSQGTKLAKG